MSETLPLEQLMTEKITVESEGRELDEEQRKLKARAKALTEQIILELKKKNNDKQKTVSELQSTISDLESQLNSLSPSTELEGLSQPMEDNDSAEEMGAATNDNVSVTEVTQQIEVEHESKDKKKRKIF